MLLVFLALALVSPKESGVINEVLRSWFDEVHGANSTHAVLLYDRTVRPERSQLRVRVFSPANEQPSRDYGDAKSLVEDLLNRSARVAAVEMPPHFQKSSHRTPGCDKPVADVVSVSRPGIVGDDSAIVYLEYPGGARAYHLKRDGKRWVVGWYVDLWQCG